MKKRRILSFCCVLVLAAASVFLSWYFGSAVFLRDVAPETIKTISVFDGNTGNPFEISDADEIRSIVENLQSTKMRKGKLSLGYSGFRFKLCFYDEAGERVEELTINSADTICRDPFFYRCSGGLCYDYLDALEAQYMK